MCGKADYHLRVVVKLDWIVDLPGRVAGQEGRGLVRQQGRRRPSRKGSAKAWDHCHLVHDIWMHALQNGTHLWIERVPSHDNISDSLTRGAYEVMERLRELGNGEWKSPCVASVFFAG